MKQQQKQQQQQQQQHQQRFLVDTRSLTCSFSVIHFQFNLMNFR